MSGTIMLCGQQQFDPQNNPLNGGLLYMLQAGTVVPQNGFKDIGLVNAYTNPIVLDASGRIPPIYFTDGSIRIRLTDRNGVLLLDYDNLPILGSSSSGAIVDTTDPNAKYNTGDLKIRYGTGALAGFVICNGQTIGPPSSGASQRANSDCQALFMYLWGLNSGAGDPDLPVSPARGASAAADWASTSPFKTIALPDFRGCYLGGLEAMGGAASTGRLTANNFTGSKGPAVLGAFAGVEWHTLDISQMPQHRHAMFLIDQGHYHQYTDQFFSSGGGFAGPSGGFGNTGSNASAAGQATSGAINPGTGGSTFLYLSSDGGNADNLTTLTGSSQAKYTIPPVRLVTVYIRL